MTVYSIDLKTEAGKDAGVKAPADVSSIAARMGAVSFPFPVQKYAFPQGIDKLKGKFWLLKTCRDRWMALEDLVQQDDIVLFQHPMYGARASLRYIPEIKKKKHCRFVALIHDLESLRNGISGLYEKSERTAQLSDHELLGQFDMLICHNEYMKKYLVDAGFDPDRIVCLQIFDYLTEEPFAGRRLHPQPTLAVAGNLHPGKSGYLYDWARKHRKPEPRAAVPGDRGPDSADGDEENPDVDYGTADGKLCFNLYGVNFDEDMANDRMNYCGSFAPEVLPGELDGDFGLVWDGPSEDSCRGNTGEYLRYNNPHKASLYLASGLPVMVWSQAAIADFILRHHAGIVVDSLDEAEDAIRGISDSEYAEMCGNARTVGKELREGTYFRMAFGECLEKLGG